MFGLGTAAVFMLASIVTPDNNWALVFLSISYTGILLQQPNLCAVVLDIARKNAGGVFAFLNTVSNAASALSTVAFGYMVAYFGSYQVPFIPMIAALALGTLLWVRVDPTEELFVNSPSEDLAHSV
jgi:predicted MFS family arabinose efflux permease